MADDRSEETYWGRVQRIASILDMRTLFIRDSQLQQALHVIQDPSKATQSEYVSALRTRDAVIHPDTGKKIFLPLRVAAIIPANMCLDSLMISAGAVPGLWAPVAAQLCNQTYNVLHYRANRNASNDDVQTNSTVMRAFGLAVSTSVLTTVGLTRLVDKRIQQQSISAGQSARALARSTAMLVLRRMVPFGAVAIADASNLTVMRWDELVHGVKVYTEDGTCVGRSQWAGRMAVGQCILARVSAAAPILLLPPVVMHRLDTHTRIFQVRPYLRMPFLLGMVGTLIATSVPLTFGLFKQRSCVPLSQLEPRLLADCVPSRGFSAHTKVYFNRGL